MAVGFGQAGDEVDNKDGQQRQPVPGQEVQAAVSAHAAGLAHDDVGHVHAGRHHEHHHQAKAHGDLVADHLRRSAQSAQKSVFGVRCPAGNDHAIDLERGDGHEEKQTGVDVGQRHIRAERHNRPGGQCRHDGHDRAQHKQALAGRRRHDDFFGQQLERVGNRLQQAERAHAVGAEPNLREANGLALPQREVSHAAHQRQQHRHDLDQCPEHRPHGARPHAAHEALSGEVKTIDHALTSCS